MKQGKTKPDITQQWLAERPDLLPAMNRLIGLLYRLSQQAEAEFRTYAQSEFGLAPGDLRILLALRRSGPLRPTDLFQSLLITSGAVTKQVYRLEEGGLVERQKDPAHKSGSLLQLTARGRLAADRTIEAITGSSKLALAFRSLPGPQAEQGLAFLQALQEAVEQP